MINDPIIAVIAAASLPSSYAGSSHILYLSERHPQDMEHEEDCRFPDYCRGFAGFCLHNQNALTIS